MPNDIEKSRAGHRDRLRKKFLASGLEGFHDYEVIELLLTLATPRRNCKEEAKAVMKAFRTLPAVMEASAEELCRVKGIGPTNVFGIHLIKAVCDRYLQSKVVGSDPIRNSQELFDYLYGTLREKNRERFVTIFLNAKNRVIDQRVLFEGTLTASAVYPREVVKSALNHQAAALIFAHNHPSGDPTPSAEDVAITRQLYFACRLMGITVHEHLIIGGNQYFSFADMGHMKRFGRDYENHLH